MKRLVIVACFVAALFFGATQSFATSVTISFSSTVTSLYDPGNVSGLTKGGAFAGSVTLDMPATPITIDLPDWHDTQFRASGAFPFGSKPPLGTWQIETQHILDLGYFGITFFADNQTDSHGLTYSPAEVVIDFTVEHSTSSTIVALASLPQDETAIFDYLGGHLLSTSSAAAVFFGHSSVLYSVAFNLDSLTISVAPTPPPLTQTPVPATLPLLVSALAGLGLAARRRTRSTVGWYRDAHSTGRRASTFTFPALIRF